MAGFTTTDSGWVFDFGDSEKKPELPSEPGPATSYLAGKDRWDNWADPILYECDCLMRQFLESKLGDPQWTSHSARFRRFTMSLMFEVLFGRKFDGRKDGKYVSRLSKVMAYYSTKVQTSGSIGGKRYTKTIYTLSTKRLKLKPPYSLKLRIEWLEGQGVLPTWRNMSPPSDDLKPGHARNKRTDENMERRREQAKRRYCERYSYRKH